jgi:type I restriction enzyme S subunit
MTVEELLGPLPREWEYTTLGEVCHRGGGDIQTGPFGSQLHASDYVPVGIPSIMPQNIGDNRIIEDGIARITSDDAKRLSRYLVRKGDIVYSRRGDVERRALMREHEDGWLCGTGCLRIRLGDKGVDPGYASFYLGHPSVREWIVRHAHGATMSNLNTAILAACPFVVPPPNEQRAIAHILGTLDDKIELNRRMNETLEAMARAIFKSWFVDFLPVRAKMEGRLLAPNEARQAGHPSGMDAPPPRFSPTPSKTRHWGRFRKGGGCPALLMLSRSSVAALRKHLRPSTGMETFHGSQSLMHPVLAMCSS